MRALGVSITSNGTRSFIVYRRINGKPERITLGRFPDLSIEQARRKAEDINATIAQGGNPNDQRRADRAELTFGALFEEYLNVTPNHTREAGKKINLSLIAIC